MSLRGHPLLLAGSAGSAIAGGVVVQRRHMRRVERDPAQDELREPPRGEPIRVRSADGTQIHAERFGDPDGLPFVLAHGWTENLVYWVYVIRELTERGFNVIAYDLRGHGDSDPATDGDYSVSRFGEDLEAVLEQAVSGERKAIVVGHSLGAMSIAAWAEHHDVPARACGAALLNTGVGELMAESLLIPVPALAQLINSVLPPSLTLGSRAPMPRFSTPLTHMMVRYIAFGPEASPAQVAFYERMLVSCPPAVRADVGLAISEIDLYHALPRLTVPTIVLAGEKDRLTPPSHARRIAEAVPQLESMIVLKRTGHMGPLERPTEVSEALASLADKVANPTSLAA